MLVTTIDKSLESGRSFSDFLFNVALGSSATIRLINATCFQVIENNGKAQYDCLGNCKIDLQALSENCLQPLDKATYLVKGPAALMKLKQVCWTDVRKEKVETILKAVQHIFKTIAYSVSALKCLLSFGLVALTPYGRMMNLIKSIFSVLAAVFEIVIRVYKGAFLNSLIITTLTEQEKKQKAQAFQDVWMIVVQCFAIMINGYSGCSILNVLPLEYRVSKTTLNQWGAIASFGGLVNSAIGYSYSRPSSRSV